MVHTDKTQIQYAEVDKGMRNGVGALTASLCKKEEREMRLSNVHVFGIQNRKPSCKFFLTPHFHLPPSGNVVGTRLLCAMQ